MADVVAISAHDVWAVGGLDAIHWDGRRWHRFMLEEPQIDPAEEWYVASVAALSEKDVWAVGGGELGNTVREPLVYHWNGRRWLRSRPDVDGELNGIAARAMNDVWAVAWDDPISVGDGSTILHWNGKTWRAGRHVLSRDLWAVAADSRKSLWAVGSTGNQTEEDGSANPIPLIERYGC